MNKIGDGIESGCFKTICSADKASYTIKVMEGGLEVDYECKSKDQKLTVQSYKLTIHCSEPAKVCKVQTSCPDSCNFQ